MSAMSAITFCPEIILLAWPNHFCWREDFLTCHQCHLQGFLSFLRKRRQRERAVRDGRVRMRGWQAEDGRARAEDGRQRMAEREMTGRGWQAKRERMAENEDGRERG